MKLGRLNHVGVATPSITASVAMYRETMETAILREKQSKGGSRRAKLHLIEAMNPHWRDLFGDLV